MGSSLSTCQLVSLFTPFLLHSSFCKTITYISLFFYIIFFMTSSFQSFIHIDDIRLHARHGVLPQEQLTGNDYSISIKIGYDISRAMRTDDVVDTLNYAEVYRIIKTEMSVPSKLIEHVAGRIADRLVAEFAEITSIVLRVTKLNPPMGADCRGAGVEIHVVNEKTN